MSGVEVAAAVSAVVSAFHGGSELVKQLKKRRRKRKGDLVTEKQLQASLEAGEFQVQQRDSAYQNELGVRFQAGDAVARDCLLSIAVVLQSEIIRPLQLAVKYDDAILDFSTLYDTSVIKRSETVIALDELRMRIIQNQRIRIPQEPRREVRHEIRHEMRHPQSSDSLQEYVQVNTSPRDYMTAPLPLPPGHDSKLGVAPLRPRKRGNSNKSGRMPDISVLSLSPEDWEKHTAEPIEEQIVEAPPPSNDLSDQGSPTLGHVAVNIRPHPQPHRVESPSPVPSYYMQRPGTATSHRPDFFGGQETRSPQDHVPPFERPGYFFQRQNSGPVGMHGPTYSRQDCMSPVGSLPGSRRQDSGFASNHSFPVHRMDSTSTHSSAGRRVMDSYQIIGSPFSRDRSLSRTGYDRPEIANIRTTGSEIMLPHDFSSNSGSSPSSSTRGSVVQNSLRMRSPSTLSPQDAISNVGALAPKSIASDTVSMPAGGGQPLSGRPCKSNNYWGFCKGAWGTQEGIKKGLRTQTRPEGMYGKSTYWQCRQCSFQGDSVGRQAAIDPRIHTHKSGITYRWIFLAKSHVKKKSEKGETTFGCILCCAEGRTTGIYGNAETLMNHIYMDHSKQMARNVQEQNKCIFGRVAANHEDFDINIPCV